KPRVIEQSKIVTHVWCLARFQKTQSNRTVQDSDACLVSSPLPENPE
ncbi:hypothetical protein RRG08_014364, partial [Elysia crispata]